jgi:hypothetical protein
MGGSPLTTPVTLVKNGIGIMTHVLADTGANGFAFIDSQFAAQLCARLKIKGNPLPKAIPANGYDGTSPQNVTSYVKLSMHIDGRRQWNLPFICLNLGEHKVILGRKWFEYFHVNLDIAKRRMLWPLENVLTPSFQRLIYWDAHTLRPVPIDDDAQRDSERRDRAFQNNEKRQVDGRKAKTTEELDLLLVQSLEMKSEKVSNRAIWISRSGSQRSKQRESIQKMNAILQDTFQLSYKARLSKKQYWTPPKRKANQFDIRIVSAPGFRYNCNQPDNELGSFTIAELDKAIADKEKESFKVVTVEETTETELQMLRRTIPKQWHDLIDCFSKKESNQLPPHRLVDHKIELETGHAIQELKQSPLYNKSSSELLAIREYLKDNLQKGFIVPSKAQYSSPVLFVSKPDGSLRFCIDYRKLNSITKKDRYPLLLIDETLARLSQAKIFTKLDIRQAFHRIRINEKSEDLTSFVTRYSAFKCKVLPFGLTNGPATFQSYMNNTLIDYLDVFCTAYLDDILIYSDNPLEHEEYVRKILLRLR